MALFKKKQNLPPRGRNPRTPHDGQGPVFSYYAHKARDGAVPGRGQGTMPSGEVPKGGFLRYLPSYLALLALIISAGYVLSIDIKPRIIIDADRPGGLMREERVYQQAGESLLAGSPLNRSKITIDTLNLSRRLSEQFPEIETAVVTLPLMSRRPVINITPATPSLLLSTRTGIYVLDDKGQAILTDTQTNLSAVTSQLPLVTDESGLEIEIGKTVLSKQSIDFISGLLRQLEHKQLRVSSLTLPALADELHVRLEGQPYFIKLSTTTDLRTASGTFLAVKERLEADGQVPKEYIDVRVEERAYYR